MLLKCYFIFGLIFYLEAASISKEIPVNVVYLEPGGVRENSREKTHVRYLQNRNLDEKVQLSSGEIKEANQHIPIPDVVENDDGKLFTKAKSVFLEKLTAFREQVDGFKLKTNQKKPTSEDWSKLNEKLQDISKKYEVNGLRQSQGGLFAELTQATGQWFQSFIGNNNNPTGQEDEQPDNQGGLGQIWNNFQSNVGQAFNNLASNFNGNNQESASSNNQGSTTSNTVLGDTGVITSTRAPGFFQIISNVFTNNNNNQGNKPGQEDTGVTPPPNIFQGAFNSIVNTFNPSTDKPPSSQGDTGETSSTSAPGNQFFQNIGNAFSQVLGQNNKPAGVSGDNEVGNKPTNFIDNVGNVLQSVFNNQNQASSTVATQFSDGTTSAPTIINQGLQQFQIPGQNGNNNIDQIQNAGQQIVQGFQNPQNLASQAQNIGQQISGNIPGGTDNNQLQQITGGLQNPQNFASQAQNIGQQISGNLSSGSQNNQAIGQQISQAFQNPQNIASQAQNIGQQFTGNLPQNAGNGDGNQASSSQINTSTLNVNQIPFIGQQLGQNSQNPIQNLGEQFQAANVINQIQNSTNQIQNPVISSNNPVNLVDTQNQQLNINQLNQIIPSNALSGNGANGIQSPVFSNGISQLNPQTGSNTFVSAVSNPVNVVSEFIQSNQQSSAVQTNQQNSDVKPVNEEKVEKKVSDTASEKAEIKGEAEILPALA